MALEQRLGTSEFSRGNDGINPEDFRPIALPIVYYKLLIRLMLNRIKSEVESDVEECLPVE